MTKGVEAMSEDRSHTIPVEVPRSPPQLGVGFREL